MLNIFDEIVNKGEYSLKAKFRVITILSRRYYYFDPPNNESLSCRHMKPMGPN